MARYYSGNSTLQFSWDQVTSAFWERYPNPFSTHVLSEDTIFREVKNGLLHSTRLLTKTNKIPKWGERFVPGPRYVCVVEESIVDPEKKLLTTYTRNIGYTKLMVVEEKCVYKQEHKNNNWTEISREAWVLSNIAGFGRAIQAFGVDRYKKNASKANQGLQYVLDKLLHPECQNVVPEGKLAGLRVLGSETLRGGTDKLKELSAEKAEKLKETARKATELAKQTAPKLQQVKCTPSPDM